MSVIIRTGGQTGVDRAAIDFAVQNGIPYTGWCPLEGWAEDYPQPPGLVAVYPRLIETLSADPQQRTAWNVRDSHATLILSREDLEFSRSSPGTKFTHSMATLVFLRPCLVLDPSAPTAVDTAKQWLHAITDLVSKTAMINIAGPRESEAPGIYVDAQQFLQLILTSHS
jgi:hypothetical protein